MHKNFINKTIITALFFSGVSYAKNLSSAEISKMVNNIKKERAGITLATLDGTANPFIIYVPKEKVKEVKVAEKVIRKEVVYRLKAIMNHAAFIDEKWYKKGDKMGKYTIGYISSTSVTLKSKRGSKTLNLKKKTKSLIKINKGNR